MKEGQNWLEFLDRAIADPSSVTKEEHEKAKELAGEWPTCACGQLCKSLPRWATGEPSDRYLSNTGLSFMYFVDEGEWASAKEVFLKIEARTAVLLEEMHK